MNPQNFGGQSNWLTSFFNYLLTIAIKCDILFPCGVINKEVYRWIWWSILFETQ